MFFVIIMICGILIFPENAIESGKIGVNLCINSVIPSLFPFFVLQDILMKLGFSDVLRKTFGKSVRKIFKISDATPLLLGLIGGYPIGAKVVSALYKDKKIDKNEASHMLSFCVNAGPAFIIGFVGSYIFKSSSIGYVLAISHIISAIIVGLLFSYFYKPSPFKTYEKTVNKKPIHIIIIESVNQGFMSILSVCSFVVFFNVLVEIFFCFNVFRTISMILSQVLGIFSLSSSDLSSLLIGFFEMTNGLNYLVTSTSSLNILVFIASFILGFGGISIHFQTMNFCQGIPLKKYFLGKILQGIISGVLSIQGLKLWSVHINVGNFTENFKENKLFEYNMKIFIGLLVVSSIILVLNLFANFLKKVYNNKKT